MLIISYDISNDKLRVRFSNFLCKFGYRLQYSVFEIKNSKRVLANIVAEITNTFEKKFDQTDSIYIFNLSENCKITKFGYSKNSDSDIIIIT